jgi:DNA polymerase III delta prime subunit
MLIADRLATGKKLAVWIDGASGIGKTTLALLGAKALGADIMDTIELDGDSCDVNAVHKLKDRLAYCSWGGGYRVVIVNEAHAMTLKSVQAWLTLLEKLPRNTAVFFTTTEGKTGDMFGQFDAPLKRRCVCISLTTQGLCEVFAARAREVAVAAGLDGQPIEKYAGLIKRVKNNLGMAISCIEGGEMMD